MGSGVVAALLVLAGLLPLSAIAAIADNASVVHANITPHRELIIFFMLDPFKGGVIVAVFYQHLFSVIGKNRNITRFVNRYVVALCCCQVFPVRAAWGQCEVPLPALLVQEYCR